MAPAKTFSEAVEATELAEDEPASAIFSTTELALERVLDEEGRMLSAPSPTTTGVADVARERAGSATTSPAELTDSDATEATLEMEDDTPSRMPELVSLMIVEEASLADSAIVPERCDMINGAVPSGVP